MRKKLIPIVLLAALVMPAPAQADKGIRQVSIPYQIGSSAIGTGRHMVIVGEYKLPAGREDRVSLNIKDASGLPVLAEVVQTTGLAFLCGSTSAPVRIEPDFPVTVRIYNGSCLDGQPAVATTGTIEAEFSWTGKKIVDEAEYSVLAPDVIGVDDQTGKFGLGTVTFLPAGRRFVHVDVTDDTGAAILVRVIQNDADVTRVCGSSDEPIKIDPAVPVVVRTVVGSCDDGSMSTPTHGVIRATFLRKG